MPVRILSHIPPRVKHKRYVQSKDQFIDALIQLKAGDRIVYHVGNLLMDRHMPIVSLLAKTAWKSFKDGRTVLVQKRVTDTIPNHVTTEYWAVKL